MNIGTSSQGNAATNYSSSDQLRAAELQVRAAQDELLYRTSPSIAGEMLNSIARSGIGADGRDLPSETRSSLAYLARAFKTLRYDDPWMPALRDYAHRVLNDQPFGTARVYEPASGLTEQVDAQRMRDFLGQEADPRPRTYVAPER